MQIRDLNKDKYFRDLTEEIFDLRARHHARLAGTGLECLCSCCCDLRIMIRSLSPIEAREKISNLEPEAQKRMYKYLTTYLEKKEKEAKQLTNIYQREQGS